MAGERLDLLLAAAYPEKSRSYMQKLIAAGTVLINGIQPRKREIVKAGDLIQVNWPAPEIDLITADSDSQLMVIHEDDDILVINKPAGLTVHPGAGTKQKTLIHVLLNHNPACFTAMMDAERRPGIVHRLDKETSGVLLIAKNLKAQQQLKADFKNRSVGKTYLALVHGIPPNDQGIIEAAIGRHPVRRQKMTVVTNGHGRYAATHYQCRAVGIGATLLEITIATGRTHQIRVHLATIGHPVIGDRVYGSRKIRNRITASRQMLHAWKLLFSHPGTLQPCQFTAALPHDFIKCARALSIDIPDGWECSPE